MFGRVGCSPQCRAASQCIDPSINCKVSVSLCSSSQLLAQLLCCIEIPKAHQKYLACHVLPSKKTAHKLGLTQGITIGVKQQ